MSKKNAIFQEDSHVQVNCQEEKKLFDRSNDLNPLLSHSTHLNQHCIVDQAATETLIVENALYQSLQATIRDMGITMNVVVQFMWHKLIQVYTQDDQTIVGTTLSGRSLPIAGIEESIGCYINTLPLRVSWDNDNSIAEQLQSIFTSVIDINAHSSMDLSSLQAEGDRLFHSLLVYENYPSVESSSGNQLDQAISYRYSVEKVDYPLNILAYEQDSQLVVKLSYDQSVLTKADARIIMSRLERILHAVGTQVNHPHHQVSLLSDQEYQTIVYDWNKTDAPYPKDKTIHQLFEEQVERDT